MPAPRKLDLSEDKNLLDEIISDLRNQCGDMSSIVVDEIEALIGQLEHYREKLTRLEELARFRNRGYAIADPETGTLRQATPDEVRRIIMRYPKKGVSIIDAVRKQNEKLYDRLKQELGEHFERLVVSGDIDGNI